MTADVYDLSFMSQINVTWCPRMSRTHSNTLSKQDRKEGRSFFFFNTRLHLTKHFLQFLNAKFEKPFKSSNSRRAEVFCSSYLDLIQDVVSQQYTQNADLVVFLRKNCYQILYRLSTVITAMQSWSCPSIMLAVAINHQWKVCLFRGWKHKKVGQLKLQWTITILQHTPKNSSCSKIKTLRSSTGRPCLKPYVRACNSFRMTHTPKHNTLTLCLLAKFRLLQGKSMRFGLRA